ncbi:hypothetical protein CAPTEDRAFT_180662 [Capitella teleta]|uniref:Uncharacterized protein n=1 Tax=Capitella teleta TaxID=283909 RepID=R7TRA6_CAPTE|nr:hypothetical protein CAPTEDRAFT_180662 [Capitella teleta]|eukprot:ELT93565.1 hypothetical protein CAPTEDRAFT_180662 [Capitella teleta]
MGFVEDMQKHFQANCRAREYDAHFSKVHSVAWNCDGTRLASGSYDKTAVSFTLDRDRLSKDHTFRGHGDSVDQLCWHPKHPDLFVTASGDKTVQIWDARSRKSAASVATKGENINICWSPDGRTIAVGNKEDLVSFIDVKAHKVRTEEQFKFEVNEISWNKAGDLFFLTSGQGVLHILSYPDIKPVYQVNAHPANLICIEFDPTGRHFAVGGADALVSLWDLTEMVCMRTFSRLDWPIRTLSFSHDGQVLASASEDLVIDIASVETGERITEVSVESPTFTVAWHPKSYLLAFACDDKDKYDRDRDRGTIKLFGLPNDKSS